MERRSQTPDEVTQALAQPSESAVANQPVNQFIIHAVSQEFALSPLQRGTSLSKMMDEDPTILRTVLNIAYHNPDIIENAQRQQPEVTLAHVRQSFPDITSFFPDENLDPLLTEIHPRMRDGVLGERKILEEYAQYGIEIDTDIKMIESVLQNLITHSSVSRGDYDEYAEIVSSHNLYTFLFDQLEDKCKMTIREQETFTAIGQDLLKARRMFEVSTSEVEVDSRSNMVFSSERERDFQGRMAQVGMLNRVMIGIKSDNGENAKDRMNGLEKTRARMLEDIQLRHPERLTVINDEQGPVVDFGNRQRWVEVPGSAELSRSEIMGLGHSNE